MFAEFQTFFSMNAMRFSSLPSSSCVPWISSMVFLRSGAVLRTIRPAALLRILIFSSPFICLTTFSERSPRISSFCSTLSFVLENKPVKKEPAKILNAAKINAPSNPAGRTGAKKALINHRLNPVPVSQPTILVFMPNSRPELLLPPLRGLDPPLLSPGNIFLNCPPIQRGRLTVRPRISPRMVKVDMTIVPVR